MERIPRTAAAAIAIAVVAAIGFGSAGRAVEAAAPPPAPPQADAGQWSFLRALAPGDALRGGPVRLSVTVPQARPGARVGVAVGSRRLTGVSRVDLRVDGVNAAGLRPAHGRFSGPRGWIARSRFAAGRHRVTLTISRPRAATLRAARTVVVPAALPAGASGDPAASPVTPPTSPTSPHRILWGAYIDGEAYGPGRFGPPWDMSSLATFEAHAGKGASIVHYGQFWKSGGDMQPFYPGDHQAIRDHGSIPLLDWNPWDSGAGGSPSQPQFALARIIAGDYDDYITEWATGARDWGHPFFLRFAHEMNGDWYPWSEDANGNSPGQYVAAWRHVHDIFTEVGATNVTWVWSPSTTYPGSIALSGLYPGDAYVDWVGIDAYNWGANPDRDGWQSFAQVVTPTYDELGAIAPGKPVMLPEVGSSELGGSKAAWITDALTTIPIAFPRIRAVVWFNWDGDGMDLTIESSESARSAFATGIASPVYAGSEFSALPPGPVAAP